MKYRTQAILAAAAVAAFLSTARPSAAQDFRDSARSSWRGEFRSRDSGWRGRDGSRRGEFRSFHGDRFRSRDDWRWRRHGYSGGYVAPYPVYDGYYDGYAVPYDGYYAYAPGYVAPYPAPVYPYAYGPRVSIRIPVPRLHLPFPFIRFHRH